MKYGANYGSAAEGLKVPQGTSAKEYLDFIQSKKAEIEGQTEAVSHEFLAADPKMTRIKDVIEQVKEANVPVLISGESGTGKEVIAQSIHNESKRSAKPFIAVNCAALPDNLLESELFGYEKGAFTGAHQRHIGKFEQASGGTLLLDEITEMDLGLQAKLLRALQEREIERIGGSGPIQVNTRIIATTNRDIVKAVSTGSFRQDLYYRLHVIHLEVPALRERKKDIEVLSRHYLKKFAVEFRRPDMAFTPDAMDVLSGYKWPGNVRELQNVIQRSVLMSSGNLITGRDLPIEAKRAPQDMDWVNHLPIGRTMHEVETQFILETLKSHHGNRTHAAKTLGISLRTLRNKINEFTAAGHEVMAPLSGRSK